MPIDHDANHLVIYNTIDIKLKHETLCTMMQSLSLKLQTVF